MLRYQLNTILIVATSAFKSKVSINTPMSRSFRVMPWDSDNFITLYNGLYFSFMDWTRWEFVTRLGMVKDFKKRGWHISIGSQKFLYRRPIKVFTKVKVSAEFFWDEKWFYAKQIFTVKEKIVAIGYVRLTTLSRSGFISPQESLEAISQPTQSREIPKEISEWIKADKLTLQQII